MSPFSALKSGQCPPAGQSLACESIRETCYYLTAFVFLPALLLVFSHWPASWWEWCGDAQSHNQQQHDDNLHTVVACVRQSATRMRIKLCPDLGFKMQKNKKKKKNRFIQTCTHESKRMLTTKKIPNLCCSCWNKLERSCSATKFWNSCRLVAPL